MRPLVVSVAIGSHKACYVAQLASVVALLDESQQTNLAVQIAPCVLDRVFVVDSPVKDVSFPKADVISMTCVIGSPITRDLN